MVAILLTMVGPLVNTLVSRINIKKLFMTYQLTEWIISSPLFAVTHSSYHLWKQHLLSVSCFSHGIPLVLIHILLTWIRLSGLCSTVFTAYTCEWLSSGRPWAENLRRCDDTITIILVCLLKPGPPRQLKPIGGQNWNIRF